MAKTKKSLQPASDNETSVAETGTTYQDRLKGLNEIAKPLATKKLTKKIYKLIKKASKCTDKGVFCGGLKYVEGKLKKTDKIENGLVILAGDVLPIDVYTHMPGFCEEKDVPYVFVPSKEDIGQAMGLKRNIVSVYVEEKDDYKSTFGEVISEIKQLPMAVE